MGSLAIFARQSNQPAAAPGTLFLAAAGMVFHNPLVPWDAGFQLSFFATLGLILYASRLNTAFTNLMSRYLPVATVERITPLVNDLVLLTFVAQLITIPIVSFHFQRLSLISVLANPLILPVQPLVMILGGLAVLAGMLFLPLGQLIAPLAWVFVAYTIRMVELIAKILGGVIATGQASLLTILVFYGALLGVTLTWATLRTRRFEPALITFVIFLTLITSLTWHVALSAPDGNLHLTLLDTGWVRPSSLKRPPDVIS
jgi:competence protein ComEC